MSFLPSQFRASPLPSTDSGALHAGRRWLDLIIAAVLFVLIAGIYYSSQDTIPEADSMWTVHVAMSIVKEGNTDLDEYAEVVAQRMQYGVLDLDGHLRYWYPLGTPVLAVPFVFAADQLAERLWSFGLYDHLKATSDLLVRQIELGIASVISALFCVVVYFTGRLFMGRGQSLILVLIAAFCTSVWSTTSRGLWQHGPSILMLSTALLVILMAEKKPWLVQFASLPLAFSWVIRPTNIISTALLSAYVLIRFRKYFVQYLLWALLIVVPALAANLSAYGSLLPPYYLPSRVGSGDTLWEALAGNLVSPGRGLLVYSPIFLFGIYGLVLKIRNSEFRLLDPFLLGILTLHWLTISSSNEGWWGGHSYGPRLFSEVIPYLLYFLIPSIRQLTAPITTRRVPLVALFALFAGLSFFIHFRGATEPAAAFGWNWQYAEVIAQVNDDPARLWDWSDPPFLRGLRPAVLHVTPQSLSFQVRKGVTSAQVSGLVVANLGDKDLAWRAKAPQGIHILSSPGQDGKFLDQQTLSRLPPGSTAQPLVMTIDLEGYRPGIHSLGAILVSAGSIDGKPLGSSPIAIPITLEIQPASSQQTRYAPLSDPYLAFMPLVSGGHSVLVAAPPDIVLPVAPPPDILLNGAAQSLAEDRIQAFYGAGWYALERLDAYSWRWTKSPAEIYIHSRSRRTIRLESKPVALYEPGALRGMGDHGTLKVTTNQQDSVEIAVQREQVFGVDLALASGWNVITLESQAGNMRPADLDPGNGDLRQLSFALDVVNLTEE